MADKAPPSGNEVSFNDRDIIVSKTDLKGRLVYTNRTFVDISGYTEKQLLGQPHSIIRHPDMPRSIFKLLWETLMNKEELFAYVVNLCKNGDHYWVLAHVTPSLNTSGECIGYHSSRRLPDRSIINNVITPMYKDLLAVERSTANRKDGMNKAFAQLDKTLTEKKVSYNEFILSL